MTASPSTVEYRQTELQRSVAKLAPWFHNLNLNGVETAPDHFLGDYPNIKWQTFCHALPADMTGMTVLDIGCNAGFYSMEMKKRGAARVVGIDSDERYLAQARFAAEVCNLAIEFHHLPVWNVARLREKFDLVIFMGVLYHLRHPLLALDLIHEHVAREWLLFQSMQRGGSDIFMPQQDYDFNEAEIFFNPDYPKLHFVEHAYSEDKTNWWIPNRACVEAMLRSSGFAIESHPENEVYLCRWRPVKAPADGPHSVYPAH